MSHVRVLYQYEFYNQYGNQHDIKVIGLDSICPNLSTVAAEMTVGIRILQNIQCIVIQDRDRAKRDTRGRV